MLVIISDLHITDESTACNVHESAFGYLHDEIRAGAKSRNAEEVHVVLLGDVFDLVRTDYWLRSSIPAEQRPWGGALDPNTAMNRNADGVRRQFEAILGDILRTDAATKGLLAMLNDLPTGIGGKPPHVTYVIGNHDRVLHNYRSTGGSTSLKDMVRSALPNVQLEFATCLRAPEYGVFARHGHEFDEICHGWKFSNKVMRSDRTIQRFSREAYDMMAIGEPLTAELMSGLIHRTARQLPEASRTEQDLRFLRNLVNVNNLRPMLDVFKWLSWFTKGDYARYEDILYHALRESLDSLLDCSLARRWDDMQPDLFFTGDITDQLEKLRTAMKIDGVFQIIRDIVSNWISRTGPEPASGDDELTAAATAAWNGEGGDIDDPRYQYIVYGHTHEALHRCFSARQEGTVRMYLNTGTYLPLIQQTEDGKGFHSAHQMTMAFFYKKEEDASGREGDGPTLDLWNGIRRKDYGQRRPFGTA